MAAPLPKQEGNSRAGLERRKALRRVTRVCTDAAGRHGRVVSSSTLAFSLPLPMNMMLLSSLTSTQRLLYIVSPALESRGSDDLAAQPALTKLTEVSRVLLPTDLAGGRSAQQTVPIEPLRDDSASAPCGRALVTGHGRRKIAAVRHCSATTTAAGGNTLLASQPQLAIHTTRPHHNDLWNKKCTAPLFASATVSQSLQFVTSLALTPPPSRPRLALHWAPRHWPRQPRSSQAGRQRACRSLLHGVALHRYGL